ncbi:MAG: MaoC family dehydratase [Bdellovibrionota bacterium]
MSANIKHVNADVGFKDSIKVQITDKMIHQFAEMCGDFNPIHLDDEYAKTTRFGRRIAHGMIVGALFSRVLNESLGGGGIYLGQSLRFVHPVYIDDILTIEIHVTAVRKGKGIASVETIARKENGEICVKGDATIVMSTSDLMK